MPGELVTAKVEIFYDADWHDITADVRTTSPITISRGLMNEATGNVTDPGSMTLMLNNGDSNVQPGVVGRYSPRNPRSDLYGKIGRNTPIRVSAAVGDAPLSTRFVGEVVAWPPRWDVSEADRWVALEAAGILRRLGTPGRPFRSSLYRYIAGTDPVAWWPLDDSPGPDIATAVVGPNLVLEGVDHLKIARGWREGETFPWLGAAYRTRMNNFMFTRSAIGPPGDLSALAIDFVYMHRPGDALITSLALRPDSDSGDRYAWSLTIDPGPFTGIAPDDPPPIVPTTAEISVRGSIAGNPFFINTTGKSEVLANGNPHHVRWLLEQDGPDVEVSVLIDGSPVTLGSSTASNVVIGYLARGLGWNTGNNFTGGEVDINHLAVWYDNIPPIAEAVDAAHGHTGETAGNRAVRLCSEEGITLTTVGDLDACTPMGPQRPLRLLELLSECATAEAAGARLPILTETRDSLGLTFRTRQSFYIT